MREPKHLIWIGAVACLLAWTSLAPTSPHQNGTDDLIAEHTAQIQVNEQP
jgi:hypothetical protein